MFGFSALALILVGAGCLERPCLQGHMETVHHEERSWLMPIVSGKVTTLIPQHRAAYSEEVFICDEYAP